MGHFEEFILLAVQNNKCAAASQVKAVVEQATLATVTAGALYNTLNRLVVKGLLSVRRKEPLRKQGGRGYQEFRLTASGRKQLAHYAFVRARLKRDG